MVARIRRKRQNFLKYAILLIIPFLLIVIFGMGIKLASIGGYEGAKLFISGMVYNNILYTQTSSKPYNSEEWSVSDDSWVVDFDSKYSGMQDLCVNIKSSGVVQRKEFSGEPLSDKVSWQYRGNDGKIHQIDAKIYYFLCEIEIKTDVDEEFWAPYIVKNTEKNNPVENVGIIFLTKVNYFNIINSIDKEKGNYSSFASVLGVEVYDIKRPEETIPKEHLKSLTYNVNFHKGMMLALYSNVECYGSGYSNPTSNEFFASSKGSELRPSDRLSDYAYFKLYLNEYGVSASDGWTPPTTMVTLRIHVLKVDDWILLQKQNVDPAPEPIVRPIGGLIEILGLDKLALALGIPAYILFIIFIILLVLFIGGIFLILFVSIALRLGVTRRGIREVTGK